MSQLAAETQAKPAGGLDPVSIITGAISFIAGNLQNDGELINMRDRVIGILHDRHGVDTGPYLIRFRLRHDDIDNIKVFSSKGYEPEWRRMYDMVLMALQDLFPQSVNPFLERLHQNMPLDVALSYALDNPEIDVARLLNPSQNPVLFIGLGIAASAGIVYWMFSD